MIAEVKSSIERIKPTLYPGKTVLNQSRELNIAFQLIKIPVPNRKNLATNDDIFIYYQSSNQAFSEFYLFSYLFDLSFVKTNFFLLYL